MRSAGLPNFRKLWGRIPAGLDASEYTVVIENVYNVTSYEGEKKFLLSTSNAFGGNNSVMATVYLIFGGLCGLFSILYFGLHFKKGKQD